MINHLKIKLINLRSKYEFYRKGPTSMKKVTECLFCKAEQEVLIPLQTSTRTLSRSHAPIKTSFMCNMVSLMCQTHVVSRE